MPQEYKSTLIFQMGIWEQFSSLNNSFAEKESCYFGMNCCTRSYSRGRSLMLSSLVCGEKKSYFCLIITIINPLWYVNCVNEMKELAQKTSCKAY